MSKNSTRRSFLQKCLITAPVIGIAPHTIARTTDRGRDSNSIKKANPIGVSTYSFWRFKGPKEDTPIEYCIDQAASMGFDGVELLLIQMKSDDNGYLQQLKRRAFHAGLDLMGFSTHQGFVYPDKEKRESEIEKTIHQIELAYQLGIPTMRLNTGRWGTIKSFNKLMANKGIEPILDGYTEDQGFKWVIDAIERCIPTAEKCGVTIGLENHWGLGRTAAGVLRIVDAVDSPWLQITSDTGNFLENSYEQLEMMAPQTSLIQAKTYYGGGTWYTLDIDYDRVAKIFQVAGYQGYVSVEFEGKEDPKTALPKSLERIRNAFS